MLKRDICCYLKIHALALLLRSHKLIILVFRHLLYFKCIHTRAALKKTEALSAEISETEKRVKDAGMRNSSLGSKMKALSEELEAVRSQVEAGHRKQRELLGVLEVRKEEKAELLGNRYNLFIDKMDTVVGRKIQKNVQILSSEAS